MPISNNIVLSEKVQKELVNITQEGDIVDAIKELINRELIRKKIKSIIKARLHFPKKLFVERAFVIVSEKLKII